MLQKPATKSPFTVVPGYSRLFRRGATYYFRVGVPKELRKAIGKTEIIKSLRTTEFQKAKQLVVFESADVDARFVSERRKLRGAEEPPASLPALSDAEIGVKSQATQAYQKMPYYALLPYSTGGRKI